MKFSCQVKINLPIKKVIELWENPDNMKEWQDGFVSLDHLSGKAGEIGAKSKISYKTGKREMELTETILAYNLPDEMSARYEHTHMVNTMTNRFESLSENQTRWQANIEYTQFNGIMPKLMAMLLPGMFKKQTQKWLNQFKTFAEKYE